MWVEAKFEARLTFCAVYPVSAASDFSRIFRETTVNVFDQHI
jgi:hypothetical protein